MIQSLNRTASKLTLVLGALALGALPPACSLVRVTHVGSGVRATETRELPPFERVSVAGHADVVVRIGPVHEVHVTFDDNLLAYVQSEVDAGELEIRLENASYKTSEPLHVEVVTPLLEGLSLAGSGDVQADGIDSEHLSLSIAGSGEMRMAGRAAEVSISIAGSGEIDLSELAADRADVSIAGSGDVSLQATETLDVSIAGSGEVTYLGDPVVSRSVMGSGEVTALRP